MCSYTLISAKRRNIQFFLRLRAIQDAEVITSRNCEILITEFQIISPAPHWHWLWKLWTLSNKAIRHFLKTIFLRAL